MLSYTCALNLAVGVYVGLNLKATTANIYEYNSDFLELWVEKCWNNVTISQWKMTYNNRPAAASLGSASQEKQIMCLFNIFPNQFHYFSSNL